MIDLHTHLLPGLDDGPQKDEDVLAMAHMAIEDGITEVCCTPHYVPQIYETERATVLAAVHECAHFLAQNGVNLKLHAGCEVRLHAELPTALQYQKILTLGDTGRYVLLELPPQALPQRLDTFFWDLQRFGYTPVLAHPERHPLLLHQPSLLMTWVQTGALVQITAGSLLGHFGPKVRDFSLRLLDHRLVHVIASDAHNPTTRPPALRRALHEAAKRLGDEAARDLVLSVPRSILRGERCHVAEPVPWERKRPLWRKILGRRLGP